MTGGGAPPKAGYFLNGRTVAPGFHDIRWIKGRLDTAHRSDAAVADMSIDGQLEVGIMRPHLRLGQIRKALNGGKWYGNVVLDRSVPASLALGDGLAQLPHRGPL